ncbi:MAG: PLP-dependent aminotransferase family protein [Burkholderiaceae bacterium]
MSTARALPIADSDAFAHPPLVRPARRLDRLRSSAVRDLLAHARRPDMISFAGGLPSADGFDGDGVRAAFEEVLADHRHALQYGESEGEPELRAALAEWMSGNGAPADAEHLLVTTGSQQALDLVARLMLDDGDAVAFARPTYLAALSVFRLAQADLLGLACDEQGPLPESLDRAARAHGRLRLLYLVPDFANPTGETIGLDRRRALLEVAARHGIVVVEDNPYGALRFAGESVRSMAALAETVSASGASPCVISVSSLSKVMAPGLRIGWLVLPESLFAAAVRIKQALDLHTSTLIQLAAARYLASGRLQARLPALRTLYGERHQALERALGRHFGEALSLNRPQGGMFVWARLRDDAIVESSAWLQRGLAHGAIFVPGEAFYDATPDTATLRLSFATNPPERIDIGVARLLAAWREARAAG